jgi:hypothetical protein
MITDLAIYFRMNYLKLWMMCITYERILSVITSIHFKLCLKSEIQFGSWVHMLPPPKKHISNSQKILPKKFAYTSRQSICFHRVSRKTDIFYGRCKKDKTSLTKSLIFGTKFCLFYTAQTTSWFFMETLSAHLACEDVHVNFSVEIFRHSKIY